MKAEDGFTMVELLIVLTVWSVLMACLIPIHHRTFDTIQTESVLKQLEDDVLLIQQLTMQNHLYHQIMFQPSKNQYILYDTKNKNAVSIRKLPKNWRMEMLTLDATIRFNSRGMITNPGTMRIFSPNHTYKVTFPFGISRLNIEKQ
ncbi:type II secretion system GspH family protein [Halobacillus yeomjeoni]|nr:type II secretion system GspH family protein [Halobacillus yeomjeoni]